MKKTIQLLLLTISLILFSGFWSGDTDKQERKNRVKQNYETLQLLYKYDKKAKAIIKNSYGYATFKNYGINIILLSAEGGTGLAHNNKTGENTYMNMGSGGLGLGLGAKDFRAVFLFKTKKAYDSFVNKGWEANAQADAAIKYKEDGAAINGAITVAPDIRLYKLTQTGLALQATIQGTKYWKDGDLN